MFAERARILLIDDEEVIRDACSQALVKTGHLLRSASTGEEGLKLIREFQPDLVLVDLKMPGKSGLEVLEEIETTDPNIVRIVITGYGTVASAVDAMKKGAYDFVPKPFTPEEIRLIVARGIERRRLLLEAETLRREQERIRRNMISLVSHELRAPLAATVQYLEIILGGMAGEVPAEIRDLVDRCDVRLREMLDLLGRWLRLATFDPSRISERFEDLSLVDIAVESIDTQRPRAEEMGVTLVLEAREDLPFIKGVKGAIEEIMNNLIGNAIKYNREGGRVRVTLEEHYEEVWLEVEDNGQGISEEHLPRIFDEFYRVDGRRNAPVRGSGLGLAIVRKMVETHGGRIQVESRPGEGTTFRIGFPMTFQPEGE